jgi:hypothetical protein
LHKPVLFSLLIMLTLFGLILISRYNPNHHNNFKASQKGTGWVNVIANYGASGSTLTAPGTIDAGTNQLILSSAIDFHDGQGIALLHAGSPCALITPTGVTVTQQGKTGNTTYSYQVCAIDSKGGITAVSAKATITTGNDILSRNNYNTVTWTTVSNASYYAVYETAPTVQLVGLVNTNTFYDIGEGSISIPYIPSSPTTSALGQLFTATILSGAGTTTLTLSSNVKSSVTNNTVYHDDTIAIQNALNSGQPVYFPTGTFNTVGELQWDGSITVQGAGRTHTVILAIAKCTNLLKTDSKAISKQGIIKGIQLNANYSADNGLYIQGGKGIQINQLSVFYYLQKGLLLGDGTNMVWETHMENIYVRGTDQNASLIPSYGVEFNKSASDNFMSNSEIINNRLSHVYDAGGNNTVDKVHTYAYPTSLALDSYGFDCLGNGSTFTNCYADTPGLAGFRIRSFDITVSNNRIFWPSGTTFNSTMSGIKIDNSENNSNGLVITGNKVEFNGGANIRDITVSGGSGCFTTWKIENNTGDALIKWDKTQQSGNVTVNNGSTSINVTFAFALANTNYNVFVSFDFNNGGWYVSNKTTRGFTVTFAKASIVNSNMNWKVDYIG